MITRWPTWTPACSGTPPAAHPQRDPVVVDDRTSGRLERSSCRGLDGGQGQSLITSLQAKTRSCQVSEASAPAGSRFHQRAYSDLLGAGRDSNLFPVPKLSLIRTGVLGWRRCRRWLVP